MDFDSPAAAQKAVTALKTNGVQAQMAKVSDFELICPLVLHLFFYTHICNSHHHPGLIPKHTRL